MKTVTLRVVRGDQPLPNCEVKVGAGERAWKFKTDQNGEIKRDVPDDLSLLANVKITGQYPGGGTFSYGAAGIEIEAGETTEIDVL